VVLWQRLRGGAGELVGHHVVSILLSYLCYYHQAFHFYSPGFMGVAEISSLPLAVVDFFKHFPALRTHFSTTNELTRQVFAVLFLALRGVYWPICSLGFWRATLATFDAGAQAQAAVPVLCAAAEAPNAQLARTAPARPRLVGVTSEPRCARVRCGRRPSCTRSSCATC
jgi:hypothetical protein